MMHEMRNPPNPTHAQALITLRTGREVPELLRDLYVTQRRSQERIAAELGVTRNTVSMWLREFGISRDAPDPIEGVA
jgi:DNA-binding XRE family transcriptional regulator